MLILMLNRQTGISKTSKDKHSADGPSANTLAAQTEQYGGANVSAEIASKLSQQA